MRAYRVITRIKKVTNAIAITTRCSHCLLINVDVRVGEFYKSKSKNSCKSLLGMKPFFYFCLLVCVLLLMFVKMFSGKKKFSRLISFKKSQKSFVACIFNVACPSTGNNICQNREFIQKTGINKSQTVLNNISNLQKLIFCSKTSI